MSTCEDKWWVGPQERHVTWIIIEAWSWVFIGSISSVALTVSSLCQYAGQCDGQFSSVLYSVLFQRKKLLYVINRINISIESIPLCCTIIPAIKRTKFCRASTIIDRITLFRYAIYSSTDLQVSGRINNRAKWRNFFNDTDEGVIFVSFDDGDDDEHNSVDLMAISTRFATQEEFFSWNRISWESISFVRCDHGGQKNCLT